MNVNYLKEMTATVYGESGAFFIPMEWNSKRWPPHWHDCMEITLVHRGALSTVVDEKSYTLYPGQALIVPPTAIHSGGAVNEDSLYSTIKIDLSEFSNSTKAASKCINAFMERKIDFPHVTDDPEIIRLIQDMLEANKSNRHFHIVSSFYKLLDLLYTDNSTGKTQNEANEFFEVLHYIKENLSSPLSTKDICKRFNYNETYFCRKFKKQTGLTVSKYILLHRLENACSLMRNEYKSIGDICTECGFSDFSYFCASFKKIYGITPTRFRELLNSSQKF